ncbi:MAG TPA: hypothetical protein PLE19_15075 [Planctomycetota bacterium]|nr:hypothetical protein [Planctomycetota bacterium]HRR81912.1 hypothetical protein [Planctomycetota bacterium]HRT97066.1 hypothetical protein [Planctomycetota bacterium]
MSIKPLRRIANWIDFAASILGAAFILTITLDLWRQRLDPLLANYRVLRSHRITITAAALTLAILLIVGAVLRAVQIVTACTEGRYLLFDTPSGPVAFRASSVEQAITRTVNAMDEVADAALELVLPKGAKVPSEARLRCRLFDRPNLLAIQDQVRATVSDRYLEMFPGQEALPVRISVERIVFETPGPKAVPPAEGQPAAEGSGEPLAFRPQYPVGD